jgi:hypothetical protein
MQQCNFRIARNSGFSGQGITDMTAARAAIGATALLFSTHQEFPA